VGSMHNAVRSLLVKAVRIYKGDEESLQTSTRSTLAELYRTHWKQGTDQLLVQASGNVMDTSLPSGSCAGSTGMDVLAAAAWHHDRLQVGFDPRVSGLDTDPTTDIEEAQNGGPQEPAIQTSATQETNWMDHQTYGQHLSHQWPQDVTTCPQNKGHLQTRFWPGMELDRSYESAPRNVPLLDNPSSHHVDQLGQAGMTIVGYEDSEGAYTGPTWAAMSEEEWLDTCANFSG
jgi:hypothetical protein